MRETSPNNVYYKLIVIMPNENKLTAPVTAYRYLECS